MSSRSRLLCTPGRGFALAAVLWLLAGLSVLIVSASVSMLTVARTARDLEGRVRVELALQRATAAVAYLVLTHQTIGTGVQVGNVVLPLDGSSRLRLEGGAEVRLQDQMGLIGINSALGDNLRRLLVGCSASASQAAGLVDALLDYTDADSLKRVNGGESFEYAAQAMPPPRNQFLASRAELWQVLGWSTIRASWFDMRCDELVTLANNEVINLWTAPLRVLLAVGMGGDEAAAALAERDRMRGANLLSPLLLSFRDRQGSSIQALSRFAVRSQGQVRVTVSVPGTLMARRFVISRVGPNHLAPYLVTEEEWVPAEFTKPPLPADPAEDGPTAALASYVESAAARSPSTNVQAPPIPAQQP